MILKWGKWGNMKKNKVGEKIAKALFIAIILIYFLGPVFWLLLSSIQPEEDLREVPLKLIPKNFTLDNFRAFFNKTLREQMHVPGVASEVSSSLLYSTIIALLVTISNLAIAIPAAYTFARFSSKSLSLSYMVLLVCRTVPAVAIIIPFYIIFRAIGLVGNISSVILAHSAFTLPFVLWILQGFFAGIPVEIEESAELDGCSRFGVIVRVVLPISAPGLISAAVFAFMFSWNEFFFSLILTGPSSIKTVTVVAAFFSSDIMLKYGIMNAASIVAVIPPLVLALIFSSYLRKGLTTGAVR